MGKDCCRYIEVLVENIKGTIDKDNLKKFGCLGVGDVVMCYNSDRHYRKITEIAEDGTFTYEFIKDPVTLKELNALPKIAYRVEFAADVPFKNVEVENGETYKCFTGNGIKYYTVNGKNEDGSINWDISDTCETHWEPIIKKHKQRNEPVAFSTSASNAFIELFMDSGYQGEGELALRGKPSDLSGIIVNDIKDQFNITYCTLDEIDRCVDNISEKVKNDIFQAVTNKNTSEINYKLDYIIEAMENKPHTEYDEEDETNPSELFDELKWNMLMTQAEYSKISGIVEMYCGDVADRDVRITYAFNN